MTSRWQISAGEISEWLPPLLFVFAALASAWVLQDARHRRFAPYATVAWTLATLVCAHVFLPLYLVARIFKPTPPITHDHTPQTTAPTETEPAVLDETSATDAPALVGADAPHTIRTSLKLRRYAPSLLYACALLAASAVYFYRDYRSFDAHLARAANARLLNRRDAAISEYRAALRLADDAHTHKLLGVQLSEAGQTEAALSEFRAAERGGDADELLAFRIASALDALGRAVEAEAEYRKFLQGGLCARRPPEAHCEGAAARLGQTTEGNALTR